jgi:hypothetical protein
MVLVIHNLPVDPRVCHCRIRELLGDPGNPAPEPAQRRERFLIDPPRDRCR